ncbi:MAG: DMT family transporter [Pseudomonadota bacterium]
MNDVEPHAARAIILALAASTCFGVGLVLTQFGLRRTDPVRGSMVSVPSAAALFWLMSVVIVDWAAFDWRAVLIFSAVGLLFPASVTLLTFEANRQMGPNITGALGNLTPVFAIGFAVLTLGETLGTADVVGTGVIMAGVMLLSWRGSGQSVSWPVWLIALPLAGAIIRGAAAPAVKWGLVTWDAPFVAALFGYSVSALVLVISGWFRVGRTVVGFDRSGSWRFVVAGMVNGMATMLMYAALAHGTVSLVSPLIATYPLITLLVSALVVRAAPISAQLIAGVVATVLGVVVLLIA